MTSRPTTWADVAAQAEDGRKPGVPGWVPIAGVAGTVSIGLGAFWLSFATLADLATRSGISAARAWVWPLIVDGVIVVATIAVVALDAHGVRATRYPWFLLVACAAISVTANAVHALVSRPTAFPATVAAAVSAVPPLVLLAVTHLTVALCRRTQAEPPATAAHDTRTPRAEADLAPGSRSPQRTALPGPRRTRGGPGRERSRQLRVSAARLRQSDSLTNAQIASRLGVHPSTVSRWLRNPAGPPSVPGNPAQQGEATPQPTHSRSGPNQPQTSNPATADRPADIRLRRNPDDRRL